MQRWCLVVAQYLYIWAFASVGFFEGHSCLINNPDPWLLPKSLSPLRTLRVLGEWQPSQNIPVNGTTEPTDLRENLTVLLTLEINNFYLVVPDNVGKGASPSIGNICWLLYIYIYQSPGNSFTILFPLKCCSVGRTGKTPELLLEQADQVLGELWPWHHV